MLHVPVHQNHRLLTVPNADESGVEMVVFSCILVPVVFTLFSISLNSCADFSASVNYLVYLLAFCLEF